MNPDERVAAYALERFRATRYSHMIGGYDVYEHVRDCPTARAHVEDHGDGYCGEGTCERFYIEAEMRCEHGFAYDFQYSESGDIAELVAHLAEMDDQA